MKPIRLFVVTLFFVTIFSSCVTTNTMYYWGSTMDGVSKYEKLTYKNYEQQTPESICDLIVLYEDMITNPGGMRNVVPPGIYAEYGFLLLQENTLESFEKYATNKQREIFETDDYATLFAEKGILMLQKEIELYPESAKFITPFIERLTSQQYEEDK